MNPLTTGNNQRLLLLDIMRAVAVLMMIQGHTIDALLSRSFYHIDSSLFQVWQVGRGLTAPIFLFGSGFAYVIANTRKSTNGRMPLPLVFRRLRWIGMLFLIGALMHFPAWSLSELDLVPLERWRVFWHVDVLRLIAVSLLGLLVVFLLSRTLSQVFALSAALTITVVVATPFLNAAGLERALPEWLSAYVTFNLGSYFPLFPFGGYLFAGAASAALFVLTPLETRQRTLITRFAILGAALVSTALLCKHALFPGEGWVFSAASPLYFAFRLGMVLLMWSAVGTAVRGVVRLPRIIPIIGQHTLFIYVFHLVVLYSDSFPPGLRLMYGKELTPYPVVAIIALLVLVSSGLAYLLHAFKSGTIKPAASLPPTRPAVRRKQDLRAD